MRKLTLFGLLPCLMLPCELLAEQSRLYTWQDPHGIRHFSQLPPNDPVDYQPLSSALTRLSDGRPTQSGASSSKEASGSRDAVCDDIVRDEFNYRRHQIEERYKFNCLQCDLADFNRPTGQEHTSCYAKQRHWREQEYARLKSFDSSCR